MDMTRDPDPENPTNRPIEDPEHPQPPVEEPEYPNDPGPAEDPGKAPVRADAKRVSPPSSVLNPTAEQRVSN